MTPAWLAGWPAYDLAFVYLAQAQTYDQLSMNAPNLWQIVQQAHWAEALPLGAPALALAAAAPPGFSSCASRGPSIRPL